MNREAIEAARATVVGKVDGDSSEADLTTLIGSLVAGSSPQQLTFDPQPLRLYAIELAKQPATLERAKRLTRALTAALPDQGFNWSARAIVSASAMPRAATALHLFAECVA